MWNAFRSQHHASWVTPHQSRVSIPHWRYRAYSLSLLECQEGYPERFPMPGAFDPLQNCRLHDRRTIAIVGSVRPESTVLNCQICSRIVPFPSVFNANPPLDVTKNEPFGIMRFARLELSFTWRLWPAPLAVPFSGVNWLCKWERVLNLVSRREMKSRVMAALTGTNAMSSWSIKIKGVTLKNQ